MIENIPEHTDLELPQRTEQLLELKSKLITKLSAAFKVHEDSFRILQWDIPEEIKELIAESLAETLTMLGLENEEIEIFAYRKRIDHLNIHPDAPMYVTYNSEEEFPILKLGINFERLLRFRDLMANTADTFSQRSELRRITAHEVHHMWDIRNATTRADESARVNAATDLTFLDPGEHAADMFGFHYRDLKITQEEK